MRFVLILCITVLTIWAVVTINRPPGVYLPFKEIAERGEGGLLNWSPQKLGKPAARPVALAQVRLWVPDYNDREFNWMLYADDVVINPFADGHSQSPPHRWKRDVDFEEPSPVEREQQGKRDHFWIIPNVYRQRFEHGFIIGPIPWYEIMAQGLPGRSPWEQSAYVFFDSGEWTREYLEGAVSPFLIDGEETP